MNDHIHKMGVIAKPFLFYGCVDCKLKFQILDAMDYLERILGNEEGLNYWRALRKMRDEMYLQWRKGVRFEGTRLPEIEQK